MLGTINEIDWFGGSSDLQQWLGVSVSENVSVKPFASLIVALIRLSARC